MYYFLNHHKDFLAGQSANNFFRQQINDIRIVTMEFCKEIVPTYMYVGHPTTPLISLRLVLTNAD